MSYVKILDETIEFLSSSFVNDLTARNYLKFCCRVFIADAWLF